MNLDRLWAGWRSAYMGEAAAANAGGPPGSCVLCRVCVDDEAGALEQVVWRGATCVALLNAFPYTSGHLMVMPARHVAELEDLTVEESAELWPAVTDAVGALKSAYRPEGLNVGLNLGRAAGAGVPGHLHVHVVPRWNGDTNFMTSVAETRVVPEALSVTWAKVRDAWPRS